MSFTKGKQKTGGRKAGVPNRVTSDLRESIKEIVEGELSQLRERLPLMEETARNSLLIKLLPYLLPPATVGESESKPVTLNITVQDSQTKQLLESL
jgi:vacuolar-type H+-ATPase subunit E/Vma4